MKLSRILSVVLALVLALSMASCDFISNLIKGTESTTPETTTEATTPEATTPEITTAAPLSPSEDTPTDWNDGIHVFG